MTREMYEEPESLYQEEPRTQHHHRPGHGTNEHAKNEGHGQPKQANTRETLRLAVSATVHCLIGCALGEVIGLIIAMAFGMDTMNAMVLAIAMGFIAGLGLGIRPLMNSGFNFSSALKTVFIGEGLSIAVMEGFEVFTQLFIPGAMEAGLTEALFWLSMAGGLGIGFVAALPVNYVMIRRGVRHQH